MPEYPHLRLPYRVEGVHKFTGGGKPPDQRTLDNRTNRQAHGSRLKNSIDGLRNTWEEFKRLKQSGVLPLPNETDIPLFLQIDTNVFNDIEKFRHWGIEIIAEEEGGYIIGVSNDNFKSFEENLNQFLQEKGIYKNTASKIWDISSNDNWRIELLLKGDLQEVWGTIKDDQVYTIEIGVTCYVYNPKEFPERSDFDDEEQYAEKLKEFKDAELSALVERDKKQIERENEIESYIKFYGGVLHDEWDNTVDAVFFKLSINGAGLRDLVIRYQYLFKVSFPAEYNAENVSVANATEIDVNFTAPSNDSPAVCIIDSGIQENHNLLTHAINPAESKSYVEGEEGSTADFVKISGHGTKVAGVVLFPSGIPRNGSYDFMTRIQNARILDKKNEISTERFAPALLESIADDFQPTRIFNLSVSERKPYIGTHMHELAASIDKLMHERDILFIISAGNLFESTGSAVNPGINEHISSGVAYPDFMDHTTSKVANPGISFFGLTVGSVGHVNYEDDDVKAVAGADFVSPFSRSGLGLWGSIKPDVVEYGGDLVLNKSSNRVTQHSETCHELVNSTMHGATQFGKDSYGTSFSAPRVSYIASRLQSDHPNESAQMYRALIVQSARLPWHCFDEPVTQDFQRYGYGIPNLERALNNNPNRVTFIQNGKLGGKKADIYKLLVPSELRGEGKDFTILVEVTLSFTAKTRVTRKGAHSYLSNWLEWKSSNFRENFNSFRNRTIQYLDENNLDVEPGDDPVPWVLRENPVWTPSVKINRNNSTVQKSWAVVRPDQLTDDFSIAVIGHIGWDKNLERQIPYALCVSFECLDAEVPVYDLMARAQIPVQELESEV